MGYESIKNDHVKGRNKYSCSWCGEDIEKGEKHLSRAYKFEGDFIADRMHLECEKAMEDSAYDAIDEGWSEYNKRGIPIILEMNGKDLARDLIEVAKGMAN